jgi:hypothetical protein
MVARVSTSHHYYLQHYKTLLIIFPTFAAR